MIVTLIITGMITLGLLAVLTPPGSSLCDSRRRRVPSPPLVLTGSAIVIGWWIGSILVSADDSLAPERFALLCPVTAPALLPGFVFAGAHDHRWHRHHGRTAADAGGLVGEPAAHSFTALSHDPRGRRHLRARCARGERPARRPALARRSTRDLVLTSRCAARRPRPADPQPRDRCAHHGDRRRRSLLHGRGHRRMDTGRRCVRGFRIAAAQGDVRHRARFAW